MPRIIDVIREGKAVVPLGVTLRDLIKRVRDEELSMYGKITYKSELHRTELLRESRESYNEAMDLVNTSPVIDNVSSARLDQADEPDPRPEWEKTVRAYLEYVEYAVGWGFLTLDNLRLRRHYMKKLKAYCQNLKMEIEELPRESPEQSLREAKALMEEMVDMKNFFFKNFVNQASDVSKNFARAFMSSTDTLTSLTQRGYEVLVKDGQLPPNIPFEELEDLQKIQVYYQTAKLWDMEPNLPTTRLKLLSGGAKALVVFGIAMCIFDVIRSQHKLKTLGKEALEFAGGYLGSSMVETVASQTATYLIGSEVISASAAMAGYVGLTTCFMGFGGGILIALAVGEIYEHVVSSGRKGRAVREGFQDTVLNIAGLVIDDIIATGGLHAGGITHTGQIDMSRHVQGITSPMSIYKIPVPNGVALLNRLAYVGDTLPV